MKTIKTAVVGVGRLGSIHARVYSEIEGCSLVGVYDIDRKRAAECAARLHTKAFGQLGDLLDKVDAVSIATPTTTHYEVAVEAIRRKRHCLIEKPITSTLVEARRLQLLANQAGVILQVGHIERFNSAIRGLLDIVQGTPLFVECHRLSPFPNRSIDVGVVMDLMIHDIDICQWMIGCPVKRCDAVGMAVITAHEDIANARLVFENGSICDITSSRVSPETMRKIRMFFKNAYASIDYVAQQIELYTVEGKEIQKRVISPDKKEPLKEELLSFLEAVREGKNPLISAEDGINALVVAKRILNKINTHNSRLRL